MSNQPVSDVSEDEYQTEPVTTTTTTKPLQRQVYEDTEQYKSTPRTTGVVKWFDDKRGIGFITVISDEHRNTDVFVHQTNVRPHMSVYRTLTTGEYVEFVFGKADNNEGANKHNHQALYVTGIRGGALMCDNNTPRHTPRRTYHGGTHNQESRNDSNRGRPRNRNNNNENDNEYQGVGSRGQVVTSRRS